MRTETFPTSGCRKTRCPTAWPGGHHRGASYRQQDTTAGASIHTGRRSELAPHSLGQSCSSEAPSASAAPAQLRLETRAPGSWTRPSFMTCSHEEARPSHGAGLGVGVGRWLSHGGHRKWSCWDTFHCSAKPRLLGGAPLQTFHLGHLCLAETSPAEIGPAIQGRGGGRGVPQSAWHGWG